MKRVLSWPNYQKLEESENSEQSKNNEALFRGPSHSEGAVDLDASSKLFAQFCNEEPSPNVAMKDSREESVSRAIDPLFLQGVQEEHEIKTHDTEPEEGQISDYTSQEEEFLSFEDSAILEQAFIDEFGTSTEVNVKSEEGNKMKNIKRDREEIEPIPLRLREWVNDVANEQTTNKADQSDNVDQLKERIAQLEADNCRLREEVKRFKKSILGACSSLMAY